VVSKAKAFFTPSSLSLFPPLLLNAFLQFQGLLPGPARPLFALGQPCGLLLSRTEHCTHRQLLPYSSRAMFSWVYCVEKSLQYILQGIGIKHPFQLPNKFTFYIIYFGCHFPLIFTLLRVYYFTSLGYAYGTPRARLGHA
jgi:hypothetical protein